MLLHGLSAGGAKPAFTDPLKTPKHVASYGWLCYIRADFDALSSFKAGTTPPDAGTPRVSRGPYDGRVDVSEPASISSGIAARYATAIFEIAKENNNLEKLEENVGDLALAIGDSPDLRDLIASPVYSRQSMKAAVLAVADKMDLIPALRNALGLMAEKRRLFVVPQLLEHLREMIADAKGEVTAEVTSATALSDEQAAKLAETLKSSVGKDVKIKTTVDEGLIGGLVVKVGSKMIDTSIRSKLNSLQNAMKEVG